MKRLPVLLLLLAAACTPQPTPQWAITRTNAEFDGKDVGLFFASYGAPAGVHSDGNEGKLYRWLSIEPMGGGSGAGYINYPNGNYAIPSDNSNGEMLTGYCEVRIRTDADLHIRDISLISDSIGKYSGSRCSEIFSQSEK
jgi:hypothetical protein